MKLVIVLCTLVGCTTDKTVAANMVLSCPTRDVEAPPILPSIATPEILRQRYRAERAARLDRDRIIDQCNQALAKQGSQP